MKVTSDIYYVGVNEDKDIMYNKIKLLCQGSFNILARCNYGKY